MISTFDGKPFTCICGELTRSMHKPCRERVRNDDFYLIPQK